MSAPFAVLVALLVIGCPQPFDEGDDGGGDDGPYPLTDVELLAAVAGDGGTTLSWSAFFGSELDHYTVSWTPGSGLIDVAPAENTVEVTGLINGTLYSFTVRTVSVEGAVSTGVSVQCSPRRQTMLGGSGADYGEAVAATSDGGFIVVGTASSTDIPDTFPPALIDNGSDNAFLARFTNTGDLVWNRVHGSVNEDTLYGIIESSDGGFLAVGRWEVDANEDDVYLLKLTSTGNESWARSPGGTGFDVARDCLETADGGFVAVGYSRSSDIPGLTHVANGDGYAVKVDSDGQIVWQSMFGGTGWDQLSGVAYVASLGLVSVGTSYSTDLSGSSQDGLGDFYRVILDADGGVTSQGMFGGSSYDVLHDIAATADGGYIVCGMSQSGDIAGASHPYDLQSGQMYRDPAAYLAKYASDGALEWNSFYSVERAVAVEQASDGGYIVAARSTASIGGSMSAQVHVLKLDASGSVEWERQAGGSAGELAAGVAELTGGEFVVAGSSESTDICGEHNNGSYDLYAFIAE